MYPDYNIADSTNGSKDYESNYHNSSTSSNFDIRDHLDKLTEDSGSAGNNEQSYHCPVCAAPNFKVDLKTGFYAAYSCECASTEQGKKKIRDTVSPPEYQKEEDHEQREYDPVTPETVTLAQFPEDYEPKLATVENIDENLIKTSYRYSESQLIIREDYPQGKAKLDKKGNPKLDDAGNPILNYKSFSYFTRDENGNWNYKKGNLNWEAYNLEEAIAHGYNGYILVVEGEKATDKARQRLGVPAITFRAWNEQGIKPSLTQLKNSGIAGIIIFPDNDATGEKHAKEVGKWCEQIDLSYYKLSPTDVWDEMPQTGDIVDWSESESYQDMIRPNLIAELEKAIHQAIDSKNRNESKAEQKRQAQANDYFVGADTSLDLKVAENTFSDNWIVRNEVFYQYQESQGYWKKIENEKVKRLIAHDLKYYFATKENKEGKVEKLFKFAKDSHIKSCFNFAKAFLSLPFDPANNHLLSLKNGTVDLRTGELGSHKKDNYLTRHIPLDYKQSETIPPLFHEFLSYSYGEDQIPLIRAVISMFLDPTAPYGKAVHLMGKSGTGKGFLTRIIKELVGLNNVGSIDKLSLIADQDKRHQNLTARSLIAIPDISGYLSDLGAFYELVDNGSMSGRALHSSDGYEKDWNVRFILASVHPLQVENAGEGWKRRIIPIPTLGKQPSTKTKDLESRIRKEELAYILGWALSMNRSDRDSLLFNSSLWAQANRDLQFEQDTHSDTVRAFIDQCLSPSEDESDAIETNVLYGCYKAFTQITGGKQKSQTNFVAGMKNCLEELYQKGKSYREDGKYKKTKPKFTNMKRNAQFHVDNFDGFTYKCNPRTLSTGGYEDFMNFLSGESVTVTNECDPDSEKVNATPETPSTQETETPCDPVTLCPSEKVKNSPQSDSFKFTYRSVENDEDMNIKKEKGQGHTVTKDTEAQKPDSEGGVGVTVTSSESGSQSSVNATSNWINPEIDAINIGDKVWREDEKEWGEVVDIDFNLGMIQVDCQRCFGWIPIKLVLVYKELEDPLIPW